jgi:hypothetical protein
MKLKSTTNHVQYVVGGADENEILLFNVVLALRDSLNILLKFVTSGFPLHVLDSHFE